MNRSAIIADFFTGVRIKLYSDRRRRAYGNEEESPLSRYNQPTRPGKFPGIFTPCACLSEPRLQRRAGNIGLFARPLRSLSDKIPELTGSAIRVRSEPGCQLRPAPGWLRPCQHQPGAADPRPMPMAYNHGRHLKQQCQSGMRWIHESVF